MTISVISNIIWALIYFKQLLYPNTNSYIINLSGIVLLPFIYFIATLFVLTIPEKKYNLLKSSGIIWSIIFSTALVVLFIILGKYNYIFLIYFILIEPLKIRFLNHSPIRYLKIKYISLAIISFIILSISTVLPRLNSPINATAMWMGGFYCIILIIIDYKFPALLTKLKINKYKNI